MQKRPLISLKAAQTAPRAQKNGAKPGVKGGGKPAQKSPYSNLSHASSAVTTPKAISEVKPVVQAPSAAPELPRKLGLRPGERIAAKPVRAEDPRAELLASFKPDLPQESLAFCLLGAANAIALVQGGTALPEALTKSFALTGATPQARGAMQDIAYRSMRQLGRCQILIARLTSKQPAPALLYGLLCAALALLQKDGDMPYEEFTVVDQAVTLAGIHPGIAHGKGMLNAVLRRFLREREELMAQVMREEVAQFNYPQWWIDSCKTAYPQTWRAILLAGNQNPPLTLRVNRRRSTVAEYLQRLQADGISASQIGPYAVRLDKAVPVTQIPGFEQGYVSVQDAGAQLAAPMLDVQDGMRVLDACAAPGGKTGHLLELADIELIALDNDGKRLQRVAENIERLQLQASLKAFDAQSRVWWDGQHFDRILADVPCTASGIVRRHPDIRWLRRRSDTLALAGVAARILDNLWQMLAPNGKLLLVTCSLWPQESEAQAAAFALRNQAIRLDAPGQLFPPLAEEGKMPDDVDGLFYALFQKPAAK